MVTRNGGRDVLPIVGMTFANRGMIAPDQMALGLAGTTTGLNSAALPTTIGLGLEGPGHTVRGHRALVLVGIQAIQEAGPISQRAFPEILIIGRVQMAPGRMAPGKTAPGLAVTAISGPMIVAQGATTEIPVLRVPNVVLAIARISTVPVDSRQTSPVLTATGVTAARAIADVAGKKVAADLPEMVFGPPALPVLTGMSGLVFQRTGTTPAVIGPVVMSAPVMVNPPVLPVLVGTRVPVTTTGPVTQIRMAHPAFRVVRAGVTDPTNRHSSE